MAGSKIGGAKCAAVNKKRNPDFYRKIGKIGGTTPTDKKKGFAAHPEMASILGKIGGTISRKPKREKQLD